MYAILRVQKHNSVGGVARAGGHKDRERETPNADPSLTPTNVTEGAQSSAELIAAVQARVDLATVKATGTDKPVIAVEYMITASPEFFKTSSERVVDAYFNRAKEWLKEKHGADNVISITRHNDEKTPHLSAFVVPLVEHKESTRKRSVIVGKTAEGKPIRETKTYSTPASINLSAKHFFGDAKALSEMQTDFHSRVAKRFNLERGIQGSRATHQKVQQFYTNIEQPSLIPNLNIPKERLVIKKGLMRSLDVLESDESFATRVAESVKESFQETSHKAFKGALEKRRYEDTERAALEYRKKVEPILEPFRGLTKEQTTEVLKIAKEHQHNNVLLGLRQKREADRVAERVKAAEIAKAAELAKAKAAEIQRVTAEREAARQSKGRGGRGRGGGGRSEGR